MSSRPPVLAISQRVVEVSARGEVRDCLDQAWTPWIESLGFAPLPIPNRLTAPDDLLASLRPAGIILSGGNNLTLPVYDGAPESTDAYASRDDTERRMVEYALRERIPVLGCCRGMQFLQAFFGGRLAPLRTSTVTHVAQDHPVALAEGKFRTLAGAASVNVNSFHNFGIAAGALPAGLSPFAVAPDGTVEGFVHSAQPVIGIMWHPERRNPASAFTRALALELFRPSGTPSARSP